MLKIKKIIRTLVIFTAAIASILSLSVSGYASRVTYKPASGYKRIALGSTYGVTMSYSVNTTKQSAICSYQFDDGAGIPGGTKTATIKSEYIIPSNSSSTASVENGSMSFYSSKLSSGKAIWELSADQISAGYKIQFINFSINCISGIYNPFWFPSHK